MTIWIVEHEYDDPDSSGWHTDVEAYFTTEALATEYAKLRTDKIEMHNSLNESFKAKGVEVLDHIAPFMETK